MSLVAAAKAVLRPMRRPLFEALGSDRYSRLALNGLDRKLEKYLSGRNGFFIECGANDGLRQSNTYWFERFRGWRGLLIEAVPDNAESCRRNRPCSITVNTALVASEEVSSVRIQTTDLVTHVSGSFATTEEEARHHAYALETRALERIEEIEVLEATLDRALKQPGIQHGNLFSLDAEGFELDVPKGMNVTHNRPGFIPAETKKPDIVLAVLDGHYGLIDQHSQHDYLLKGR